MKWGTLYSPAYVNNLRHMVRRNLRRPHRFVCFTEDAAGIEPDIEVWPLPKVNFPPGPERFWNKLGIFSNPLADLTGSVLCLDLDVVIVDSIDCFFEPPGGFFIIKEFSKRAGPLNGNMSVCRFDAGAHPYVLEEFHRDPLAIEARFTFDQDYISNTIKPVIFWPKEWCVSFKKHCLKKVPMCYFTLPKLPPGARIVAFHGHPKPPDAARGCFIRGGVHYIHATPWVVEHWK